ncbi:ESPR-type extended signal peptide-containing protein [Taylorella equigenitalis]|uniref:ESPR-type extended signal peptide-containing protein n=1 Tax=Taylorella equigenitalis TaxID=29575 RepID=UPI0023B010C1|nr:ESPR-type extended signal peptide-containing protein [Taylorella equigenitalis]WEE01846.1 ESPR-type extended signal peptide-containing protein [Taylorella equigenitalis]WFD78383.1 ESPR-type extended signal peptide-containing protein [Taylorella equigenitalis]WFD79861.1 ESPR-type extended signal peptide-containing protein [Taylorella equigenitalis]WFD81337.1 ESPR-type extended signal peptide-containing protein [Taylorella equigenitalis]WFD82816.1 ESPR-type extended signal peptide-containing 
MNKIFKTIYNKTLNAWVVVSECTKSHSKKTKSSKVAMVAMLSLSLGGVALADDTAPKVDVYHLAKDLVQDDNGNIIGSQSQVSGGYLNFALINGSVVGYEGDINPEGNVSIGAQSFVKGGTDSFAIGSHAQVHNGPGTDGFGNYAIGAGAQVAALKKDGNPQSSIAIGSFAKVYGRESQSIGYEAQVYGNKSVAIGHGADVQADMAYAFGFQSHAFGKFSMSFGATSIAKKEQSIVLGVGSEASDTGSMVIGNFAYARGPYSSAFGTNAQANTGRSVAVGTLNYAGLYSKSGDIKEAIRNMPNFNLFGPDDDSVANEKFNNFVNKVVEANSNQPLGHSSAIGVENVAVYKTDVAMGFRNYAVGFKSVAIGRDNIAKGQNSIAFGQSSFAFDNVTIANGINTVAKTENAVASGIDSVAIGSNSVAYGTKNVVMNNDSASIGNKNVVNAISGVAVGSGNRVGFKDNETINQIFPNDKWKNDPDGIEAMESNAENLSAFGVDNTVYSTTKNGQSTAVGSSNIVLSDLSIASGHGNKLNGIDNIDGEPVQKENEPKFMVAYGANNFIANNSSTAIGHNNELAGTNTLAFGANNKVINGEYSVLIGNDNKVTAANTVGIGRNINATLENSVYLGADSASGGYQAVTVPTDGKWAGVPVASTPVANGTRQATPSFGIVTVGSAGHERQIQHVAAGRITETSTDAVNGSQLNYFAKKIEQLSTGGSGATAPEYEFKAGTGIKVDKKEEGGKITITISKSETSTPTPTPTPTPVADLKAGANKPANEGGANPVEGVKELNIVGHADNKDKPTTDFDGGKNIQTTVAKDSSGKTTVQVALKKDLEVNSVTLDSDGSKPTKLAVNKKGTPALGKADKKSRLVVKAKGGASEDIATINDGLSFQGDGTKQINKSLNKTLKITGGQKDASKLAKDSNVGVLVEGEGENQVLAVRLSKNLTGLESAEFGDKVTVNAKGLNIKDGPSVTQDGIDAGGKAISNVADGLNPTDAVNMRQLSDAKRQLENKMKSNHDQAIGTATMAMAMANLPQAQRPGDKTFAVAGGTAHGKASFAVGLSASSTSGKWQLRGSVSSSSNGDVGAGFGAGYTWR